MDRYKEVAHEILDEPNYHNPNVGAALIALGLSDVALQLKHLADKNTQEGLKALGGRLGGALDGVAKSLQNVAYSVKPRF